jgi:hypothetical protein
MRGRSLGRVVLVRGYRGWNTNPRRMSHVTCSLNHWLGTYGDPCHAMPKMKCFRSAVWDASGGNRAVGNLAGLGLGRMSSTGQHFGSGVFTIRWTRRRYAPGRGMFVDPSTGLWWVPTPVGGLIGPRNTTRHPVHFPSSILLIYSQEFLYKVLWTLKEDRTLAATLGHADLARVGCRSRRAERG